MNIDKLKNTALFRSMKQDEIALCLKSLNAQEKEYSKESIIMYAGSLTNYMGLVLSGSVTIESNDVWGNCTILTHVGMNDFFAETYALLPQEIMRVDVRANEDCRILFVNIDNIFNNNTSAWKDKLIKNLLMISAHKNLTLSIRSFHTSSKSARARILSYLNTISLQKNSKEFDIPFDRQQLADYLNLERTNMSKELGRMKREGILEFRKNHFKLLQCELNEL